MFNIRSAMDQMDRLTNPLVDCQKTIKHLDFEAWKETPSGSSSPFSSGSSSFSSSASSGSDSSSFSQTFTGAPTTTTHTSGFSSGFDTFPTHSQEIIRNSVPTFTASDCHVSPFFYLKSVLKKLKLINPLPPPTTDFAEIRRKGGAK